MVDGKKAILVVSFGTSYNNNREKTIGAIEADVRTRYPDWDVRRAFTSRMIIKKLRERDGICIDYVTEAMDKLVQEGYETVLIQPTHVMNGIEYDDVVKIASEHLGNIKSLRMGRPLLTSSEDYDALIEAVEEVLAKDLADGEALVLMGHGSDHYANATYSQLQMKLWLKGMRNVFVTTVEGFPGFGDTIGLMKEAGFSKAALFPLMVVAGDHATEDMAGDEDGSLKRCLMSEGFGVSCIVRGMGEFKEFRELFLDHIRDAMERA